MGLSTILDWLGLRDPPPKTAPMAEAPSGQVRLGDGRRVRVRRVMLDLRPVTNAEWQVFMQATNARRPAWMYRPGFGEPEQPVVGVTLGEALAFARWAGKRLPSEAEWLWAAQGDDARRYPWGDAPPDAARAHFGRGPDGAPAPVMAGARPAGAGPFGHQDLAGNVWEWCQGGVLRGAFWGSPDPMLAARLALAPGHTAGGVGFRCAG